MTSLRKSDGTLTEDPIEAVRPEQFGASDSPETRAEQLGRLQRLVHEATKGSRGRRTDSRLFELVVGTGGASVAIEHRLGRVARWAVVDWARATPGGTHGLERSALAADTNDANTLTLRSYVAGSATVEVW